MPGFVFATALCANCRRMFSFNPHLVPSIRVNGKKEPVCQICIDFANPKRKENGMPEFTVMPGAYEPMPEEEL